MRKEYFGIQHPETTISMNNLGIVNLNLGIYEEAEYFLNKAVENNRKLFGDKSDNTANTLNALAGLYSEKGEYEKSLLLLEEAVEILNKTVG